MLNQQAKLTTIFFVSEKRWSTDKYRSRTGILENMYEISIELQLLPCSKCSPNPDLQRSFYIVGWMPGIAEVLDHLDV